MGANQKYNKEWRSQWYQKNKDRPEIKDMFRNNKLKHRYKISLDTYNEMHRQQEGRCKICNTETKLHVDHCHNTDKVRGLLCYTCNNGMGCFKDSRELLLKAASYLDGL